jgi:hypothetical protein
MTKMKIIRQQGSEFLVNTKAYTYHSTIEIKFDVKLKGVKSIEDLNDAKVLLSHTSVE